MTRFPVMLAAALVLYPAAEIRATKQHYPPRPCAVLQSVDQFIALSTETTATLYTRAGEPLRSFEAGARVTHLELSADQRHVRLWQEGGAETVFDVATGAAVGPAVFREAGPPPGARFRLEVAHDAGPGPTAHLVVQAADAGQPDQTAATVNWVHPGRWRPAGVYEFVAEVFGDRDRVGVGYRFDPRTGELVELFRFTTHYRQLEHFDFDTAAGYGVATHHPLMTVVSDMRTATIVLRIDNNANYHPPVLVETPFGELTLGEALARGALLIGALAVLVITFVLLRRLVRQPPATPEAKDYGEARE